MSEIKKVRNTSLEELKKINQLIEELKEKGNTVEVYFDFEATGLDRKTTRIHEIGAVIRVDGKDLLLDDNGNDISNIQIYFNPWLEDEKLYQSKEAYSVHGIDNGFLKCEKSLGNLGKIMLEEPAGTLDKYIAEIYELFKKNSLLSHNGIVYDIPLLNEELKRHGFPTLGKANIMLDTYPIFQRDVSNDEIKKLGLQVSRKLSTEESDKGLVPLLEKVNDSKCEIDRELHGALADTLMLVWCVEEMRKAKRVDGTYYFPTLIKRRLEIEEIINFKDEFNNIDILEEKEETNVIQYFYTDEVKEYAEDSNKLGSVNVNNLVELAKEYKLDELTLVDYGKTTVHRKVFDKFKESGVKINYGVTLAVKSEDISIDMLFIAKNMEGYNKIIKLIELASRNNNHKPYLELNDIEAIRDIEIIVKANKDAIKRLDYYKNYENIYFEVTNKAQEEYILKKAPNKIKYTHEIKYNTPQDIEIHKNRVLSASGIEDAHNQYQIEDIENKYLLTNRLLNEKFNNAPKTNQLNASFEYPERRDIMPDYFTENESETEAQEFERKINEGLELFFEEEKIQESEKEKYYAQLEHEKKVINGMLNDSIKRYEEGKTFDIIKFDSYLLGMADKIEAVKFIRDTQKSYRKETGEMEVLEVGPGRGSAAGSLVARVLKITNLDSIKYGLSFERFLNPERISFPDIDTDFAGELTMNQLSKPEIEEKYPKLYEFIIKRHSLSIEDNRIGAKKFVSAYYDWYHTTKRGRIIDESKWDSQSRVAGILTQGEYKAKTVIADICKVYASYAPLIGFSDYKKMSDYFKIFVKKDDDIIEDVINENDELREKIENNVIVKHLFDKMMLIEGTTKSEGTHAAGIVVKTRKMEGVDTTALVYDNNGFLVADKIMKYQELVKDDILGLKNLELISGTISAVQKNLNINIDLDKLNQTITEEELVEMHDILAKGDNEGLFQIESDGMKDLFKRVFKYLPYPKSYEELLENISVLIALYRPGPMESGMLEDYIEKVQGKKEVEYDIAELEPILKNTYGVIAYQEQVMAIVAELGGFTGGEADLVRRAMGKKDADALNSYKAKFVKGGVSKGLDGDILDSLFEKIKKFAGYGFNKAHSVAYGRINMDTLYLKANYRIYFNAERLNYHKNKKIEDFAPILDEIMLEGVNLVKPDIMDCSILFEVKNEATKSLNYSLNLILGEKASRLIRDHIKETANETREERINWIFDNLPKGEVMKLVNAGMLWLENPKENIDVTAEKYYTYKQGGLNHGEDLKQIILGSLSKEKIEKEIQTLEKKEKLTVAQVKKLEKLKIDLNKPKRIVLGTVLKKLQFANSSAPVWRKETLEDFMTDEELKLEMEENEKGSHAKLLKKIEEFVKESKIKCFPQNDYERWRDEFKVLGQSFNVSHPLESTNIKEYERLNKIPNLKEFIDEFETLDSFKKEGVAKNSEKFVGMLSGMTNIVSKKGKPMIIGDLKDSKNRSITTMYFGENIDEYKEILKDGSVVSVSGSAAYDEEKGIAFFIEEAEVLDMNKEAEVEEKKTVSYEVTTKKDKKNIEKNVVRINNITSELRKEIFAKVKIYGDSIYYNNTSQLDNIIQILENMNINKVGEDVEIVVETTFDNKKQIQEKPKSTNKEINKEINKEDKSKEEVYKLEENPKNEKQYKIIFAEITKKQSDELINLGYKVFGKSIYVFKDKWVKDKNKIEEIFNVKKENKKSNLNDINVEVNQVGVDELTKDDTSLVVARIDFEISVAGYIEIYSVISNKLNVENLSKYNDNLKEEIKSMVKAKFKKGKVLLPGNIEIDVDSNQERVDKIINGYEQLLEESKSEGVVNKIQTRNQKNNLVEFKRLPNVNEFEGLSDGRKTRIKLREPLEETLANGEIELLSVNGIGVKNRTVLKVDNFSKEEIEYILNGFRIKGNDGSEIYMNKLDENHYGDIKNGNGYGLILEEDLKLEIIKGVNNINLEGFVKKANDIKSVGQRNIKIIEADFDIVDKKQKENYNDLSNIKENEKIIINEK